MNTSPFRRVPDAARLTAAGSECLVMLRGPTLGRKLDLGPDRVTIGRDLDNHVVLDADHVSRFHAAIEVDALHRVVSDLGSTNGTWVNDRQVDRQRLHPGDLIQIGEVVFKYLAGRDVEAAYHEEIYQMAITDGLTSVPNSRFLAQFLEREMSRSRRYGRDLSLLFIDADKFKEVNTRLGHVVGDQLLRELAHVLEAGVGREELCARYGGEEFVIVLPEVPLAQAVTQAEAIRRAVEAHRFTHGDELVPVTVSVGVAAFEPDMRRPEDLVRAADAKLHRAKDGGRNRVVS